MQYLPRLDQFSRDVWYADCTMLKHHLYRLRWSFPQARSKELNGARTELLEDLKTGFQKLPKEVVAGVKSRDSESVTRLRDLVGELFDLKLKWSVIAVYTGWLFRYETSFCCWLEIKSCNTAKNNVVHPCRTLVVLCRVQTMDKPAVPHLLTSTN